MTSQDPSATQRQNHVSLMLVQSSLLHTGASNDPHRWQFSLGKGQAKQFPFSTVSHVSLIVWHRRRKVSVGAQEL